MKQRKVLLQPRRHRGQLLAVPGGRGRGRVRAPGQPMVLLGSRRGRGRPPRGASRRRGPLLPPLLLIKLRGDVYLRTHAHAYHTLVSSVMREPFEVLVPAGGRQRVILIFVVVAVVDAVVVVICILIPRLILRITIRLVYECRLEFLLHRARRRPERGVRETRCRSDRQSRLTSVAHAFDLIELGASPRWW